MNKLYARSATGKILVWWMTQDNNSYTTTSGQLDGKLVTSEPTICQGKNIGRANETSAKIQAEMEMVAKYKKQLKTGYFLDIKDVDSFQYIQPMLAKNYKDYADKIDWAKGVIVQIKFNGMRCIATRHGLFTRKGERYVSVPHIENSLKKFFEKYPDAVLDGELFNYALRQRLNEIACLIRKQKPTAQDLANSEAVVEYHIYDGYGIGTFPDDVYVVRKQAIDQSLIFANFSKYVKCVICWTIHSPVELDVIYNAFLNDEQEGAILRIPDSPYEHKRSKYLLKFKPIDDSEFIIKDIIEGEGNWAGTGKIIEFSYENGKRFRGTFKGTFEQAQKFLAERQKWIGKTVTVEYNGLTGLGTPNYARMDINNCEKS